MKQLKSIYYVLFTILVLAVAIIVAGCGISATPESAGLTGAADEAAPDESPSSVVAARDAVLEFLRVGAIAMVPPEGTVWQTYANSSPIPAGFDVYRFMAEDCKITVSYAKQQPSTTLYNVNLTNQAIGFCWQAVVDSEGKIVKTGNAATVDPGAGNPASLYCEEQGNQYKIITLEDGSSCGACVFPDETACNGWDFFYGECRQGDNPILNG